MENQKYEKPKFKFVSLRNKGTVSNTCWGLSGENTVLFCDVQGEGYASFQIASGGCNLNLINVKYHSNAYPDGEEISSTSTLFKELEQKLTDAGGAQGNAFKGEGSTVTIGKPDSSWS